MDLPARKPQYDKFIYCSKDMFLCTDDLFSLRYAFQGCWVLSFDWVETCTLVKMRVEEEGFEVSGCSTAPTSGASRLARIAKEAGSAGLFHSFRICLLVSSCCMTNVNVFSKILTPFVCSQLQCRMHS